MPDRAAPGASCLTSQFGDRDAPGRSGSCLNCIRGGADYTCLIMRDRSGIMASMNRLPSEKRKQVIACLVEGNSIRATCRLTGVAKDTVTKLLSDLGLVCSIHMDRAMRDLPCERIQCDEIWAFVYAKQKNVPLDKRDEAGDVWTWIALDPDSKLVPTFHIGPRDLGAATTFMHDLAPRLRNRVQLTTDGWGPYLSAVPAAFGRNVDYAQLVKTYGTDSDPRKPERRYSPSVCLGADSVPVNGNPDPDHISTSHVERLNLTVRMSMRRYTRLTNAFSKKVENLAAAVAIHFTHYNFCRVHGSLDGKTPAMAAGITDHVWSLDDLIGLLEAAENVPTKRGRYAKTRAGN
jgi:IS1 family transposase